MSEWAVKVRREGMKSFRFVVAAGLVNRLKVHALRFRGKQDAWDYAAEASAANPGFEWKVVRL